MKVEVTTLGEKGLEDRDYRSVLIIDAGEGGMVAFWDGEPEDANLGRDFSDCYAIPNLMKMAYEAGRNGEDFEIVAKVTNDVDSLY